MGRKGKFLMRKYNPKEETVSKHISLGKSLNARLKEEAKQNFTTVNDMVSFIISEYFQIKNAEKGNATLKEIVYRLNEQNEALRKILSQNSKTILDTYYRLDDFLRTYEKPFDDDDELPIDNS